MPAIQDFIVITNSPEDTFLAQDYQTPGPIQAPDVVRSDVVDFSIQPVIENAQGSNPIYSPDYVDTDTFTNAIGNFDTPPTGGVFSLQIGAVSDAGLLNLQHNISAAALQSALNVALTTEGAPNCNVALVTAGTYQITASANGVIASGLFQVTNYAALYPTSTAVFIEGTLGTASSPYVLLLVLSQQPMCVGEPTVELDPADVDITTVQAGAADANKIQNVQFSSGAYGGSATISATANAVTATCGTITPGMTTSNIGGVLNNHPQIHYNDPDGNVVNNVVITQVGTGWNVEFVDNLANDDGNELTSSNSDVTGPQGKSGQIQYNTFNLWLYSITQEGDSFQLTRQIQRTRASGEVRTIYSGPVTIKKSMINLATSVPTPITSYYTAAQVDGLLAAKVTGPGSATANAIALYSGTTGKLVKDGPLPTTVGTNLITLANPSAIRFLRVDAGNTVTPLTAAAFSLAITTNVVLTTDGAITIQDSIVYLEKTSGGAFTIAAPSSQDGTRIVLIGNTDFAHVVTFTGSTLLDGTTGANLTATFTAFKGSSITIVARGAFWLVESLNLVVCAP